jgi:DNA-binding NarL/FixJ family response regulator
MSIAPAPEPTTAAGILVVDDHDLVRLGLRTLVESHASDCGHAVPVLEARNLHDALCIYADHAGDIGLVLLDLHLPDARGLSALNAFLSRHPAAQVVVLSGINDPVQVRQALARGAKAYLPKSGDLQHVIHYIRSVGLLAANMPVAVKPAALAGPGSQVLYVNGRPFTLTDRQVQILDWMLAGCSNREIAAQASLSEGTVKNHVSALLLLFGLRSRAQLISQFR